MAVVPSFFEALAQSQNIQAYLDNSQEFLQSQSIWRNYLDEGVPQNSLSFQTIIGRSRIEAAASIVDPDSSAPLRARGVLESLPGQIPTMKQKFKMSQSDMRKAIDLQNWKMADTTRKNALLKLIYDDVSKCAVAGDKRVDILVLQALSTLQMNVSSTLNPDGVVYGTVDLLAKAYQKQGVPIIWTDPTAVPITNIQDWCQFAWTNFYRKFKRMLMSQKLFFTFSKNAEVKSWLASYYNTAKSAQTYSVTLDKVNEALSAYGFPVIEIIDYVAGVETDGVVGSITPFNETAVSFVPDGKLGILENAYPMENIKPVANKSYANYGPTLVSKWMDDDPLQEFTQMEMNACPSFTELDNIFVLRTELDQDTWTTTP